MQREIKAIIFDFGNVIINIDLEKTFKAFSEISYKSVEKIKEIFRENEIFKKYETGLFDDDEFREVIRQSLGFPLNDMEIDKAWNALLLDVPTHRIDFLEKLRLQVPIYLLSNTNSIHILACKSYFRKNYGYSNFLTLFKNSYLSYEMGLWKPDYSIYDAILKDLKLEPDEVLFLDDNADNISAASDLGIRTIKINPPECFTEILGKIYLDV